MIRKKKVIFFSILSILLLGVYTSSLVFDFTYLDDQVQIVENPFIKVFSFSNLSQIFSSSFVGMYQPFTTSVYMIIHQLAGMNPTAFHCFSLFIHFLNCFLLYKVISYFFKAEKLIYLLIALFALHPMQVESLVWVSAFSNILYSFFFLLSIYYYLKYIQDNKSSFYLTSILFFVASCFSKSMAVTLPILLFVFDFYYKLPFRERWKAKIPFLCISIIFGLITIYSRETAGHLSDLSIDFNWWDRIFLVSHSILFYPLKFLFPYRLSAFYPYPIITDGLLPTIYYLSPIILIALILVIAKYRRNSSLILGISFFIISISIVLQLIPFGNQITTDRYIYLPMLGLLIVFGTILSKWTSNNYFNLLFIIPLGLAFLSYKRTAVWENDETLWLSVIEEHPSVPQAYNNLGSYAFTNGDIVKAFNYFNKAIELQANYADAYSNRGNLYSKQGNSSKAIADFNRAIALKAHPDAYFNRANEYANAGLFEEAIKDYSESIAIIKKADSYANRAYAFLRLNNISRAKKDIARALQINPDFDSAIFLKGLIAKHEGNTKQACDAFRKAAALGNKSAQMAVKSNCS